ncbi:hypothetical protein FDH86_gp007 [Arthrobacter phage Tank]|uniref:Uncharacterized protein n=1 Tax=Arthrobacter phage Tank TaxID=1772319 RepID=A0A0U4B745_9CAUD|nr:hypothetical protein FDH86_gp007 [Arthrobacter phage Tank]ALY10542.1 hypothetical protein TANK_7 [Arthrobacter phage Tank]
MMEKYQGPWFPREAPPIPPADPKPLPDFTAIRLEAEVAYPSGMQEFVRRTVEFQTMRCERFLEEVLRLTPEEKGVIVAHPDLLARAVAGESITIHHPRGFGKKRRLAVIKGIMDKAENPPLSEEQIKHRANHWKLYEDPVGRALVEEILRRKAEKNG